MNNNSIHRFAFDKFSQSGEDGIIAEAIKRINPHKTCCEFGANDAKFCSNTYKLLKEGWKGFMFEADPNHFQVAMQNLLGLNCDYAVAEINAGIINELVPQNLGVLSLDTDGPDAGLWSAYTGKADIVVIEINSSLDPDVDFYHPDRGANFSYMNRLAEAKGYFLLAHTGNCIYVLNKYLDLFPDRDVTFKRDWL